MVLVVAAGPGQAPSCVAEAAEASWASASARLAVVLAVPAAAAVELPAAFLVAFPLVATGLAACLAWPAAPEVLPSALEAAWRLAYAAAVAGGSWPSHLQPCDSSGFVGPVPSSRSSVPSGQHQEVDAAVAAVAVVVAVVVDAAAVVGVEGAETAAGAVVKPGHPFYLETLVDHCGEQ